MTQFLIAYVVQLQVFWECKTRHDLLLKIKLKGLIWCNSCAIVWLLIGMHFRLCKRKRQSETIDWLFFFPKLWDWQVLCTYLPQPLFPASIICVCVDMCARVSVGQSECQQWRWVQGIRRLLATAVPLVGTDPAGSLWVGEHKWRCVWGVVAANGCIVIVTTTTTTTTVAGHEARPAWCRLTWAIERTRKLYLLHYPWLKLLLDLLLLSWMLGLCGSRMGCVGRRQIERVLFHSQAHIGDRL